mgnify:CR=1 FL=1
MIHRVSGGDQAIDLERPLEAPAELRDLDGEDLQAGFGAGVRGGGLAREEHGSHARCSKISDQPRFQTFNEELFCWLSRRTYGWKKKREKRTEKRMDGSWMSVLYDTYSRIRRSRTGRRRRSCSSVEISMAMADSDLAWSPSSSGRRSCRSMMYTKKKKKKLE